MGCSPPTLHCSSSRPSAALPPLQVISLQVARTVKSIRSADLVRVRDRHREGGTFPLVPALLHSTSSSVLQQALKTRASPAPHQVQISASSLSFMPDRRLEVPGFNCPPMLQDGWLVTLLSSFNSHPSLICAKPKSYNKPLSP